MRSYEAPRAHILGLFLHPTAIRGLTILNRFFDHRGWERKELLDTNNPCFHATFLCALFGLSVKRIGNIIEDLTGGEDQTFDLAAFTEIVDQDLFKFSRCKITYVCRSR